MTGKADFTGEEWDLVLEGPATAGAIVATAQRGGTFRESFAMARAYVDSRKEHGASQLLDEITAARPEFDRKRYHSPDDLRQQGVGRIGEAVGLLMAKATPDEVEDYRRFVLSVADRVAKAHREGGESISDAEQAAIDEIRGALRGATP